MSESLKMILLIDSSYPINTRCAKILSTLKLKFPDCKVEFVTWNRDKRVVLKEDKCMSIYSKPSTYGHPFKKFINLLGYYRFLRRCVAEKHPRVLIASHWDMLLLASFLKKEDQILVYDNLDIPTSGNRLLLKVFQRIEHFSLKKVDAIIFASRFFSDLYMNFHKKKILIENKPMHTLLNRSVEKIEHTGLVISYIGIVRYIDILQNLVDAVRNNLSVTLNIHGEGPDLNLLRKYAKGETNIHFTGRFEQKDLPELYGKSDLIWASYPNKDYNVKYAISNKFHESIAFKIPGVFSNKTMLGEFIFRKGIGFMVDPYSIESIKSLINNILNNKILLDDVVRKISNYSEIYKSWDEEFLVFESYLKHLNI